MKIIPLTKGQFAVIDDCDYNRISRFNWVAVEAKRKHATCYYALSWISSFGKMHGIYMHSLLMDMPVDFDVDHKNDNGLDNRRQNLRISTRANNIRRSVKWPGSSSVYKGVYFNTKSGKYIAEIGYANKPSIKLGSFINEIDAARAYDKKAKELFGDFVRLNFPNN